MSACPRCGMEMKDTPNVFEKYCTKCDQLRDIRTHGTGKSEEVKSNIKASFTDVSGVEKYYLEIIRSRNAEIECLKSQIQGIKGRLSVENVTSEIEFHCGTDIDLNQTNNLATSINKKALEG